MFRKLLALEVAAIMSSEEANTRPDRNEADPAGNLREAFTPRTGNYGSMWSLRSLA
jgi:hypothetical protein